MIKKIDIEYATLPTGYTVESFMEMNHNAKPNGSARIVIRKKEEA